MKLVIFLKLLQPRIVERYPIGPELDDMKPLENQEGELLIIEGKGVMDEEKMRDKELGSLNRNRPREAGYEADDEESDPRSHHNLMKSRRYIIVLDSKSELGKLEVDKAKDPK